MIKLFLITSLFTFSPAETQEKTDAGFAIFPKTSIPAPENLIPPDEEPKLPSKGGGIEQFKFNGNEAIDDDQLPWLFQKAKKAVDDKDYRTLMALFLLLIGWGINKKVLPVVMKDKQYQSVVPWIILAMAESTGIGTALMVPSVKTWDALKTGMDIGVYAIGGWELVGKHLLTTLPALWKFYKEEEVPKLSGLWTRFKASRALQQTGKDLKVAEVAIAKVPDVPPEGTIIKKD